MYDLIFYISIALPVVILFSTLSFCVNKFLKNVRKNEKLAWTLIFVHPSTPKGFKVLTITALIFSISWFLRALADFFYFKIPLLTPIGTYLILLAFIYLFKTLAQITKEK